MTEHQPALNSAEDESIGVPKPSRLARLKSAARKTGAVAESTLVAVTGVATMDALATPASASAGTEIAMTHEAQSPQAFIKSFDKKLDALTKRMPSSPHFDTIGSAAINKVYRKSWHKNIVVEHIGVPSKKYPGHYDWLAVSLDGDTGKTLWASINLGTNSKTYAGMDGVYKEGYGFFQTDGSKGQFLPNSMLVSEDPGSLDESHWFGVSTEGYPFNIPKPIMKYAGHQAEVSAQFNAFLNTAQAIVTHK